MVAFATPAELAEFAKTPLDAPRMTSILDLASGVIRRHVGQHVSLVTGDQVEYGPTTDEVLFLPERPVIAVTSVVVDSVTITTYDWTRWGTLRNVPAGAWDSGAVVTYDHGFDTDTDEFSAAKAVCLAAAARAYTLNERSASEAIGPTLMEAAGYSPEVFLTPGEKTLLMDLGGVLVG